MQWYQVQFFSLDQDLAPLLELLKHQSILHRVTEEAEGQCLWVANEANVMSLREFLSNDGLTKLQAYTPPPRKQKRQKLNWKRKTITLWNQFPITLLTIYFGILGALLVSLDHQGQWVPLFTFQSVTITGSELAFGSLGEGIAQGEWWRLVTPIFLHFGIFHILFNGLWVWEFGRRIEQGFGSSRLTGLIVLLALGSNSVQYLWSGPSLFGGLSGVLYGLMGFLWIYNKLRPYPLFTLPPGIIGFMLFWMVLCMTEVVDLFMDGSVANGAHFGGLICGMAIGAIAAKLTETS